MGCTVPSFFSRASAPASVVTTNSSFPAQRIAVSLGSPGMAVAAPPVLGMRLMTLLQECEVPAVRREHRAATVLGAGQRHRRELIERPHVHLRYAARTLGGVGEQIAAG